MKVLTVLVPTYNVCLLYTSDAADDLLRSLVGSEMCIRDRSTGCE